MDIYRCFAHTKDEQQSKETLTKGNLEKVGGHFVFHTVIRRMDAATSNCESGDCEQHFHAQDPVFATKVATVAVPAEEEQSSSSEGQVTAKGGAITEANSSSSVPEHGVEERGFRRIIRNFTPS